MKVRALGLLSGGLDSSLSALLLLKQGIEVEGLYFNNGFCIIEAQKKLGKKTLNPVEDFVSKYKINLRYIDIRDEFLEILKNPKYGYGSAFNPCIDCRIMMLKKAKEIMEDENFDFIFTGEVLKQRPMTQMPRTLKLIEIKSGLEGLIVRPLSQKLLPETIPEKKGLIKRELLMDIEGRGRKKQIKLAKELGLSNYPSPAGGCCFLTDKNYKGRFLDLINYKKEIKPVEFFLIKIGRHFRLSKDVKLIIGRDEKENEILMEKSKGFILLVPSEPAPYGVLDLTKDEKILNLAAEILLSFCKRKKEVFIDFHFPDGEIIKLSKLPEQKSFEIYKIK
ncbi:MAG: hypothetical protein WHV67_04130 [Thermoanaerobaculia bacterium]